jgi:hypothetical protein
MGCCPRRKPCPMQGSADQTELRTASAEVLFGWSVPLSSSVPARQGPLRRCGALGLNEPVGTGYSKAPCRQRVLIIANQAPFGYPGSVSIHAVDPVGT